MICFICKIIDPTLASLITHYKIIHLLGPHSSYTCQENDCSQSFQTLSSFKKHFIKKHIENCLNKTVVSHDNDIINTNDQVDGTVVSDITDINDRDIFEELETPKAANKTCDINNRIEMFHTSVVQFLIIFVEVMS